MTARQPDTLSSCLQTSGAQALSNEAHQASSEAGNEANSNERPKVLLPARKEGGVILGHCLWLGPHFVDRAVNIGKAITRGRRRPCSGVAPMGDRDRAG